MAHAAVPSDVRKASGLPKVQWETWATPTSHGRSPTNHREVSPRKRGALPHIRRRSQLYYSVLNKIWFRGCVLLNRRAAQLVSFQNTEWRRVDVNGDQVATGNIGIAELMNVGNL